MTTLRDERAVPRVRPTDEAVLAPLLTNDELLSTTRAVRKGLDLDRDVPRDLIRECIELATQAPTGSNMQSWHFMVVTERHKRERLAAVYRRAFELYRDAPFAAGNIVTGDPGRDATQQRVMRSAEYLAGVLHRVPVHVIPCVEGRVEMLSTILESHFRTPHFLNASVLGSIIPAAWSFCLAARARGLGTSWTTIHLLFEEETAEILGIPYDSVAQTALIPVAYTRGTHFKRGPRMPIDRVLHFDGW